MQHIKFIPFSRLGQLPFQEEMNPQDFVKDLKIRAIGHTLLLQYQTHLAETWTLVTDQTGKIDPKATILASVKDDHERGMWRAVVYGNRSDWLTVQSNKPKYSALVPIILAAFKNFKQIPYSAWSTKGLELVVGKDLYQAMLYQPPELTREELLHIRQLGLTSVSTGEVKPSKSTWKLNRIGTTNLCDAPRHAVNMLTQTWLADPEIRHPDMVLDPVDWDKVPEPLVSQDIFVEGASIDWLNG